MIAAQQFPIREIVFNSKKGPINMQWKYVSDMYSAIRFVVNGNQIDIPECMKIVEMWTTNTTENTKSLFPLPLLWNGKTGNQDFVQEQIHVIVLNALKAYEFFVDGVTALRIQPVLSYAVTPCNGTQLVGYGDWPMSLSKWYDPKNPRGFINGYCLDEIFMTPEQLKEKKEWQEKMWAEQDARDKEELTKYAVHLGGRLDCKSRYEEMNE